MPAIHRIEVPRQQTGASQDSSYYHHGPKANLLIIADGVGGMEGGRHASRTAVTHLTAPPWRKTLTGNESPRLGTAMARALRSAHKEIKQSGQEGACTVVALRIGETHANWAWVGDSRLYRVSGKGIECLTSDDSLLLIERARAAAGQRAVLTPREEAELAHIITQALGTGHPKPHTRKTKLRAGDLFVLATDGFYEAAQPGPQWIALWKNGPDPKRLQALEDEVRASGPGDDATALFCWTDPVHGSGAHK